MTEQQDQDRMDSQIDFLSRVEILSLLEPDDIGFVSALFTTHEIGMNEVLFREGDRGNELFIVKSGAVTSTLRLKDGSDRHIARFGPGDFFGEMSIFENAPRSATCVCAEPCTLLGLHERDFYRMIERRPDIAVKIMYRMLNITTQRLRGTGEFLSDMVQWGEAARRRSITDELTGAYNRRFLDDALAGQVDRARSEGSPLSLAMVDLDFFRDINAEHGHEGGDRCIVEVVRAFNRVLREGDLLARFGGDEFIVLMPNTPCETALEIAERGRAEVESLGLMKGCGGREGGLTISIGIASFPDDADDPAKLKEMADQALYLAKEWGRNQVALVANGAWKPTAHLIKRAITTIYEKNRIVGNIIDALGHYNHFLFLGHKSPDEDCIGSMVAFALIIGKFGRKAAIYLSEGVHEHFQYLLNICTHNAIDCIGPGDRVPGPVDVIVVCDTPKPAMIDAVPEIMGMLEDRLILKIEVDHHLGADSQYIGDEGYRLVTEATSSSELVGLLALKLSKRQDIMQRYNVQNPLSRNVILSVLTGIVGDTSMGQYIISRRQKRYYDIFSNLYNSMLAQETTKESNFVNKDEIFHEIQRLSSVEERCYRYIIGGKKFSRHIGYTVLGEDDMRYLYGEFDGDTIVSVTRSIADHLAEESGFLGLVAYDDGEHSGLVQFRLRRGQKFKTFDLRKVIELFSIEEGGGHEGAVGFRVPRGQIDDVQRYVAGLIEGIEKALA